MTEHNSFHRVSVSQAQALLAGGGVLLLDVRDANSFLKGHIEGAQNVSVRTLSTIIATTPRSTPILICCHHGLASQDYARIFADFRFQDVYSLDGGYEEWRSRVGSISRRDDEVLRDWLAAGGFADDYLRAAADRRTTPLMRAAHTGRADIVRTLLAAGADLSATNADGNNALWLACVGEHLEIIDLLIEAGVDLDNRNDNGATALMYAASSGKARVVARLLAARADCSPETLDGFTALDMASTIECLAMLRKATAGSPAESAERLPAVWTEA